MPECYLDFQIIPGAKKTQIILFDQEAVLFKIKIAAPPIDGKANQELIEFLEMRLKKNVCEVLLVKGHKSRKKRVFIKGLNQAQAVSLIHG